MTRIEQAWALRLEGYSAAQCAAKMGGTRAGICSLWYRHRHPELTTREARGEARGRAPRLYTARLATYMDQDMHDRVVAQAKAEGCSKGEIVRTFIEWGFNALDGE